jgi:hypothetical protein
MAALLATDPSAARTVVNLILKCCDEPRVRAALGRTQLSGAVEVRGERPFSVPASRHSSRPRDRRYDLLFVSDDRRAVAVEVKLGAALADRQLQDLLDAGPERLGLDPTTRVAVVVLGPRELELSPLSRRHDRLLGVARWSQLVDSLVATEFADPAAQELWGNLFRLYVGRSRIRSELGARPGPKLALEAVAMPLREHVQRLVGDRETVQLDANAAGYVTRGQSRAARIEIFVKRRRSPRPSRRIVVRLEVPKGGRRRATIDSGDRGMAPISFPAPARVDALRSVLEERLTQLLQSRAP